MPGNFPIFLAIFFLATFKEVDRWTAIQLADSIEFYLNLFEYFGICTVTWSRSTNNSRTGANYERKIDEIHSKIGRAANKAASFVVVCKWGSCVTPGPYLSTLSSVVARFFSRSPSPWQWPIRSTWPTKSDGFIIFILHGTHTFSFFFVHEKEKPLEHVQLAVRYPTTFFWRIQFIFIFIFWKSSLIVLSIAKTKDKM